MPYFNNLTFCTWNTSGYIITGNLLFWGSISTSFLGCDNLTFQLFSALLGLICLSMGIANVALKKILKKDKNTMRRPSEVASLHSNSVPCILAYNRNSRGGSTRESSASVVQALSTQTQPHICLQNLTNSKQNVRKTAPNYQTLERWEETMGMVEKSRIKKQKTKRSSFTVARSPLFRVSSAQGRSEFLAYRKVSTSAISFFQL